MRKRVEMSTRRDLIGAIEGRYRTANRREKTRILDEFVAVSGLHRKHAVRLLGRTAAAPPLPRNTRRIYDEAVQEALRTIWETADRICGKRLKPVLPVLLAALEGHGYLQVDPGVRARLLAVSPATIDRLLASPRAGSFGGGRRRRRPGKVSSQVPIRTFADWHDPIPGFFEGDFVVHSGGSMSGHPIHTLTLTDIASGWTECLPLLVRDTGLTVEALQALRLRLPVALRGLDTDNDSVFINEALIRFCADSSIEFTRSRAGRKNDQAWVEQKNGAIVRRLAGYARFEGVRALLVLRRLFEAARSFVNFFQPSFKLQEKVREGARVRKRYSPPATPCDRLLGDPRVSDEAKARLRGQQSVLDPVVLLKEIRDAQSELASLRVTGTPASGVVDLEEFVRLLPDLWRIGEVRPTHQRAAKPPRGWRTRSDPFEEVWPKVLGWLEREPDTTARLLFDRLVEEHPSQFTPGQL